MQIKGQIGQMASLIGFDTLFLLAARRLSLQGAVRRISSRLGLNGKALISPFAEIGMDIDKPYQLELLREDLQKKPIHES